MNDARLYDLVVGASNGTLDAADRAELDAWLAASADNKASYDEIAEIVAMTGMAMEAVDPQTDMALAAMQSHMRPTETPAAPAAQGVVRPPFWTGARMLAVAAAVAVLAVVGYLLWPGGPAGSPEPLHFATALGETKEVSLPDGSKVQLNGGSTLDAAAGYGATDRRLRLRGEAFFEVAKDRERPFVVSAGEASAEALGTAFNVRMTLGDGSVQLSVTEGRVRFAGAAANDLVVEAGQAARFVPGQGITVLQNNPQEDAAWTRNLLVFKDAPFAQAAEQIERSFGVALQFPDRLKEARVNANFDRKPLADVLDVLGTMYGLKVEQSGKVVTLSE